MSTSTRKNPTKRAMMSSIVSLVLCFSMFLGTTFAWFTDNATTNVNRIESGTLDVMMVDANGADLEGKTVTDHAKAFYTQYGYGDAETGDGLLLMIHLKSIFYQPRIHTLILL